MDRPSTGPVHAWCMDPREDSDRAARPGLAPAEDGGPAVRLVCDGEVFELRPDGSGGTQYTWLSGPNPGYGFGASPTTDDIEAHRTNIRGFLSMVDPSTGYIEEQ